MGADPVIADGQAVRAGHGSNPGVALRRGRQCRLLEMLCNGTASGSHGSMTGILTKGYEALLVGRDKHRVGNTDYRHNCVPQRVQCLF